MAFSIHKKISSENLSIFFLSLFLFIQISSCFNWDGTALSLKLPSLQLSLGNIFYDLETNTFSDFTIEAVDWTLSSYKTAGVKFYNCAGNYIIGGYSVLGGTSGQYFQRTYPAVPIHNQIYIQMRFYQLDSWDQVGNGFGYDYFSIGIDGTLMTGWYLNNLYSGAYSLCGYPVNAGNEDFVFTISLAYPHSASSLTLKMISYGDEDSSNESFGFRDIKIEFLTNSSPYFSLCAPGVPSSYLSSSRCSTSCTASGNYITPASYGLCFTSSACSTNCQRCSDTPITCTWCQTGWYLVGTTCYPTCDSPFSSQVLGGVTYCVTPCPGQYIWWDQSCFPSCTYTTAYGSYAMVEKSTNSFLECTYQCATNEYLYANTSCLSSCPSPLISTTYKGKKFCEYPCGSSQYLYWNGSCLNTCPSPLVSETQSTSLPRNFCWYPCAETQYLYWNGSCLDACPYPLASETQSSSQPRNFCWYPCAETEFLYWNGSCIATCPSPLASEIQGTLKQRNFCWYTCSETQYLYWNGSCIDSCPYPLAPEKQQGISSSRNFCWYTCTETDFLYWNGSCIHTCPSPLSPEIQGTSKQRNFCWYKCSETQYLYWNGSCLDTCPYPLASEIQHGVSSSRKFCWYLCQPSEYLFWNGSCINNCPSPLSPEIQGTSKQRNFCWYTCSETQYLYWNGSCIDTCPYPLAPEIQSGVSSSRKFCWYSCAETDFLYWNGSCINNCPSPLSSETQGTSQQRNFCWYTCSETQYLYWNGSCLNACPYPLSPETQGTSKQQNFCWYTCSETQYLYWNGSCIDSCPYPLTPEKQQGISSSRKFCWYTCQPSEYLYWNGSCINTCPSPLSPETQGIIQQRNFCWYICQPSEHLYWNQSCGSHCPIPLVSFDLSNNLFCFLPCSMPIIYWYQDFSCRQECNFPYNLVLHDSVSQCLKPCNRPSEYFYDLEKECHDTCNPPYIRQIINTIKVCHITRSTLKSETEKIKSTVELIETLGKITSAMIKAASIPQLSTPRSPFLIQHSSLMQYIRYMRINYPWRVQLLFQENGADLITLSFDFSIPNKIQNKFDNYPLPYVFEKYGLDSNFINNMWDLINTVLLVMFSILALILLNKTLRKSPKASHILTRILQSLRWNIPLAMISGGAGEIIFYTSLQVRNTPLDSTISFVSFFISLSMIFWVIVIVAICLKLLRGFHLQRQKVTPVAASSSETPDWLEKWKGYEILYEEIEEKYLFSLAYMVVYIIRAILFFTILANFYDYPLTQSILINVINLLIFIYLLYYKPLKDMWNTIQLFINEILGNVLTICVLTLAIMDKAEIEARDSRVTIGNVIIIIMLIFYFLGVVFLVIEGVLFCIEAYKTWKEMRARGIKNPFKIIEVLLFGEAKPKPEEITLELSQNSSRLNLSTVHTKGNSLQVKPYDNHPIVPDRRSSMMSDMPGDISSRYFFPNREPNPQRFESRIARTKIQSIEFEIDTSRANLPMTIPDESKIEYESPPKEMDVGENISGFFLRENYQPSLPPNVDHIQNWGNLKARMKRFNQSTHKIHWPSEE